MAKKIETKDNIDDIFYVEFEQGFRYITERGDWIILNKTTTEEPGAKFMHLTLLDKETYEKAKTYQQRQETLDDLMDRATEQDARSQLNKNDWESE